jgi:hypothetical protein
MIVLAMIVLSYDDAFDLLNGDVEVVYMLHDEDVLDQLIFYGDYVLLKHVNIDYGHVETFLYSNIKINNYKLFLNIHIFF